MTDTTDSAIPGVDQPIRAANTIIVGAGAAGMNAAVHLVQFRRARGVADPAGGVAVATRGVGLGASRMSGSDKQTYYKMGTSPDVADAAADFARTLTAGGACHGDTALIEALGSLREFYHLVQAGVPFPHDPLGAFIGYKTDHDPAERATSAGPKTSRFMSECLQRQAAEAGVKIFDGFEPVEFVTADGRIVAMIALDRARVDAADGGLTVFVADHWVLAAGGPGELYEDTVYPRGQIGLHGAALAAGLVAVNLTESQFGLASTDFRWNVSGTYMQAVPRIFSTDPDGADAREFLTEYFDAMPPMAGAIFLKGYQWPFDAQRIAGGGSSLIDMAVHQETAVRGRRVWMDFLHNPVGRDGWAPFRVADLPDEAREYLAKAGATQATPIERLDHMNRPAIEIYAEHGIDLRRQPLRIAVCAQHHNGGFAVDAWWRSPVPGTFVIGEMAGTHGVKRPGGSALNAGQVGGLRAAEYIAGACSPEPPDVQARRGRIVEALAAARERIERHRAAAGAATPDEALAEIRRRMTRHAAHLRSAAGAENALADAIGQYRRIARDGLHAPTPRDVIAAIQAEQQCRTHVGFLFAVREMLARGAGSRGSHCVLDPAGVEMHPALIDPESRHPYRVKDENLALRDHVLAVRFDPDAPELFVAEDQTPRPIPHRDVAFETAWREFREGRIYDA